jgi:hypothetical protein
VLEARVRAERARATAAELVDSVAIASRFLRDAPGWMKHPVSPDLAEAQIRGRLERRAERFLESAERLIYANPSSPYLALLRHAGCEPGDLRLLVTREGVEGALSALAGVGVFCTLDELKGRADAVRGSQRFRFSRDQFANPHVQAQYVVYTGGTRGQPTRIRRSLDQLDYAASTTSVVLRAHRLQQPRHVIWQTGPIGWLLCYARIGQPATDWFYPIQPLSRRLRLVTAMLRMTGWRAGVRFPVPRFADLRQPERLAGWLGARRADRRPIVMTTVASAATRIAIAANARGIRLDHVTFTLTSEPTTPMRRAHIEASGARVIVHYAANEAPNLTYSCAAPGAADDVHVSTDCYALIDRTRPATLGGPDVEALLITSLNPSAATVCLNTELGDYARVAQHDCDCAIGRIGLRTHLSEIRSFEKLTGEGVTFGRDVLERMVERVLPTRFGGTSMDYQIAEEEASGGVARVQVRVAPSVGPLDERAVLACVLAELERGGLMARNQAAVWRTAGTLTVVRQPPLATAIGKVLPFHLIRRTTT